MPDQTTTFRHWILAAAGLLLFAGIILLGTNRSVRAVAATPVIYGAANFVAPGPGGIEIDLAGNVYIVDDAAENAKDPTQGNTEGAIFKFDATGALVDTISIRDTDEPTDVAVNPTTGDLWIVDEDTDTDPDRSRGKLYKLDDKAKMLLEVQIDEFVNPFALALDSSGNVFVVDRDAGANAAGRIFKFSDTGILLATYAIAGSVDPQAIDIDPATDDIYVLETAAPFVYQLSSAGVLQKTINLQDVNPADVFVAPQDLAFDPSTNTLYFADPATNNPAIVGPDTTGALLQTDTNGNFLTSVGASGFSDPAGITVAGNGTPFVIDSSSDNPAVPGPDNEGAIWEF